MYGIIYVLIYVILYDRHGIGVPSKDDCKAYTYCEKAYSLADDLNQLLTLEERTFPMFIPLFIILFIFIYFTFFSPTF